MVKVVYNTKSYNFSCSETINDIIIEICKYRGINYEHIKLRTISLMYKGIDLAKFEKPYKTNNVPGKTLIELYNQQFKFESNHGVTMSCIACTKKSHLKTDYFELAFNKTIRLPNDNNVYPCPPTLDECNLNSLKCSQNIFAFHMYQKEALRLNFVSTTNTKYLVKVDIGGVNVLTNEVNDSLSNSPQNYLLPSQKSLDGFNAGQICDENGKNPLSLIRQFVASNVGNEPSDKNIIYDTNNKLHFEIYEDNEFTHAIQNDKVYGPQDKFLISEDHKNSILFFNDYNFTIGRKIFKYQNSTRNSNYWIDLTIQDLINKDDNDEHIDDLILNFDLWEKSKLPNCQIFVSLFDGKHETYNISTNITIREMKQLISDSQGIPIKQMRLSFGTRYFDNTYTLADIGIGECSTFQLMGRLRGCGVTHSSHKNPSIGLFPGGYMKQEIDRDDSIDVRSYRKKISFSVKIMNSKEYLDYCEDKKIKSTLLPSNITQETYSKYSYAWDNDYDESQFNV